MHNHKSLYLLSTLVLIFISNAKANAQGLSLKNMNEEARLLDRYEILSGELGKYYYGTHKNIDARNALQLLSEKQQEIIKDKIDTYNYEGIKGNNLSSLPIGKDITKSKKNLLKIFYTNPNNFLFYTDAKEKVAVQINPIINYTQLQESNNAENVFVNQKGVDVQVRLSDKIFLYTQLTDNQERLPIANAAFANKMRAVPGAGYIKDFKTTAWDYTLAKGYVSADIVPNKLNVSFGHDKFFIGDGYRSLFLSDFTNNYLFLKTNTKFWKFRYQTLLTELTGQKIQAADGLVPKKYGAMHHLGMVIGKKLNVGVFEAVMFGRKDHFDFQYLNPIIFYRTVEQQLGSPDNALLGIDAKYLPIKNVQVYGQLMLDEFIFKNVRAANGHWANKQAYQIGAKYINAFGIKHLDMQVEHNNIRPYTYSYADSLAEYSNYKQALAHPNGANLREQIVSIYYQPLARLNISLEAINRKQGLDTSGTTSVGSDIFRNYTLYGATEGHKTLDGLLQKTGFYNLNFSYQLLNNINIDLGGNYRTTSLANVGATSTTTLYLGMRLNSARRKYNY